MIGRLISLISIVIVTDYDMVYHIYLSFQAGLSGQCRPKSDATEFSIRVYPVCHSSNSF